MQFHKVWKGIRSCSISYHFIRLRWWERFKANSENLGESYCLPFDRLLNFWSFFYYNKVVLIMQFFLVRRLYIWDCLLCTVMCSTCSCRLWRNTRVIFKLNYWLLHVYSIELTSFVLCSCVEMIHFFLAFLRTTTPKEGNLKSDVTTIEFE